MNIILKTLLFFNYLDIFCGCCNYNKNEKHTEINNNNEDNKDEKNPEINNDNDNPTLDDDKDKKPPVNNKNRRPSYFTWNNGNCAVQVFCLTFIMIFKDNPDGKRCGGNKGSHCKGGGQG